MTLPTPIALIVNPHARGNWIEKHWSQLEPILQRELSPNWTLFTRGVGDGRVRAKEALESGARLLVALGGDGTASEVASSILDFQQSSNSLQDQPVFSFLSCGTGGDLRRTYGTSEDLQQALTDLRNHGTCQIDVGKVEYKDKNGIQCSRYFLNVASFGIGGLVDQFVNKSSKRWGGKITYFLETLRATFRYNNAQVNLQLQDHPPKLVTVYDVAICNGRFFGGGMKIAPDAQVDDGLFDVITHGDLSIFEIFAMAGPLYRGTHLKRPKVSLNRVSSVIAIPANPLDKIWLDVDGESLGCLPATFTLIPKALSLRV